MIVPCILSLSILEDWRNSLNRLGADPIDMDKLKSLRNLSKRTDDPSFNRRTLMPSIPEDFLDLMNLDFPNFLRSDYLKTK